MKLNLSQISLGIRLAILSAMILLLTSALFVFISIKSQKQNAIKLVKTNTTNLGQSFERILRFSMQKYHREEIKNAIMELTKTEDIKSVTLSNHKGYIKYSTSDLSLNSMVPLNHQSCTGCHINENKILENLDVEQQFIYRSKQQKTWTIIPVYNSKNCSEADCHIHPQDKKILGIIEIAASTTSIENELRQSHILLLVYSLLIATLVFFILRYFYQRLINRPVMELIKGTKLIALGKLDHVIPQSEAEFGELADSFNRMQIKLKETQQQLIMTEKLISIGKLSAGVAHEINNPLTGILSYAEGLIMECEDDDPKKEDYQIIKREALHCRTIVKNLLDFTRQEVPELKAENINNIIRQTLDIVQHQVKFSKINIIQNLYHSLPEVRIDAGQINQVLLNLLINASEAMPEGGTITIYSRYLKNQRKVEVSVKDTGSGISQKNLSKIFEPFFSTKEGKTNGLGLSISMEIIKNHNGEFKVESKLEVGTTFFIVLPIIQISE